MTHKNVVLNMYFKINIYMLPCIFKECSVLLNNHWCFRGAQLKNLCYVFNLKEFMIECLYSTYVSHYVCPSDVPPSEVQENNGTSIFHPSKRPEEDIYVKDPTSRVNHTARKNSYLNSAHTRYDGRYILDNDFPSWTTLPRKKQSKIFFFVTSYFTSSPLSPSPP